MPNLAKQGNCRIPEILLELINFIAESLPARSIPTFIELMMGAMLTKSGFVTDAILAINAVRNWTTYYKWIQKGKWSWLALGRRTAEMVLKFFPSRRNLLIVDDTIVYRSSSKAPGSAIYHQHGNKPNRPKYARGQCWVTMAMSIGPWAKNTAVPLLSRLMREDGNSGKLVAAATLLRSVAGIFKGNATYVLADAWFMKWPFIKQVFEYGFQIIGQVRKDTALYLLPEKIIGKRGAPRKFGEKINRSMIDSMTETTEVVYAYGKWQTLTYRSCICIAKFMGNRLVRAVWSTIEDEKGKPGKERLIISSDFNLDARSVILLYSRRWGIEELFNQLKNLWGWKETWQQTRQTLHRWVQILSVAYTLPQILAVFCQDSLTSFRGLTPWRKNINLTAGQVRIGLKNILCNVRVRDFWNRKSKKIQDQLMPDSSHFIHGMTDCRFKPDCYMGHIDRLELDNCS